jgi:hypothetical protein
VKGNSCQKTLAMRNPLLIFLLLFSSAVTAQKVDPIIKNGKAYDQEQVKPFLHSLHVQNDYVLAFRVVNPSLDEALIPYLVLTKLQQKLAAYYFNPKTQKLSATNLSADSLTLLWNAYIKNGLLDMKDEKDVAIFCPEKYNIYNSYTYEITLISKDQLKRLSYYDPEYYDRICPGMEEREKIISFASFISSMKL